MGKLIFGEVEFTPKQTKAINEMIEGWKEIGKEELLKKTQSLLVDYGTLVIHENKTIGEVTKEIYKIISIK